MWIFEDYNKAWRNYVHLNLNQGMIMWQVSFILQGGSYKVIYFEDKDVWRWLNIFKNHTSTLKYDFEK